MWMKRLSCQAVQKEIESLIADHPEQNQEWFIISNEVGLGLVPAYQMGRVYRDALGWANQRLAREADHVLFMVAGIPMKLSRFLMDISIRELITARSPMSKRMAAPSKSRKASPQCRKWKDHYTIVDVPPYIKQYEPNMLSRTRLWLTLIRSSSLPMWRISLPARSEF